MKKKILVIAGGISNEREISLRSGQHVAEQLKKAGYDVILGDPQDKDFDLGVIGKGVFVALPMLHGQGGEDGLIQAELEKHGILYVGSRPKACQKRYSKDKCKVIMAEHGILTPAWQVVDKQQFDKSGLRESAYVLKPIRGGSSIDMLIVHNPDHQPVDENYVMSLFEKYDHMLLEELIEGQEVTVGILGDKPLPLIQIIPPAGEEFDFTNKYNGKTTEIPNPPDISIEKQQEAQATALRMHEVIGCRDISRTDMIIAENGAIYVLEINTAPGMTEASLYPKAVQAAGINMPDFMETLVLLGAKR
jgi:D-alanine-D-alanine ligase